MRIQLISVLAVLLFLKPCLSLAESSARSMELSVSVKFGDSEPTSENASKGEGGDKKPKQNLKYFLTIIREGKTPAHIELQKGETLKPEDLSQTISLGSHTESFIKTIEMPEGSFLGMVFSRVDDGPCEMSESNFKNSQACLPMQSKWHCNDLKINSGTRSLKSTCLEDAGK